MRTQDHKFRTGIGATLPVCAGSVAVALTWFAAAFAQSSPPPGPPAPLTPPAQLAPAAPPTQTEPGPPGPPAPAEPVRRPGFIDELGRWVDQGLANFRRLNEKAEEDRKKFRENAEEARRNATQATKEALESMSRLPGARVVVGRERCEPAANGAPDCHAAAEALCRKNGFRGGKSLEFTSAEECPPRVLLSGRQSGGECKLVTFINRAMCQ